MLALQQSLMDRTSEPTETPVGFATETGAGGFTGGAQMFDMGMDPTFADTGGWGVTQDVTPKYLQSVTKGLVLEIGLLKQVLYLLMKFHRRVLSMLVISHQARFFSDTHAGTGTQSRVGRPMVNASRYCVCIPTWTVR